MAGLSTIKRGENRDRYYVHPGTGEKLPGVTTILNMEPKPFLTFWAAKVVAEHAVENFGALAALAVNDKKGAIDWLKRAPQRNTGEAADVGTLVHDYFELRAKGKAPRHVHPDVKAYVQHIEEFFERYEPEFLHLEDAVISETHKYAGSFDWIAKIGDEIVIGDNKTTRSGVHSSVGCQLSAYRHADYIVTQSGERHDIPAIDAAAVLHLRPEGWKLVPVRSDAAVFEQFLYYRATFEFKAGLDKDIVGAPDYDSQAAESTGSKRRSS